MHWLYQEFQLTRKNLLNKLGMVLYLKIIKLQLVFTLFALHMSHAISKKTWNQMVIIASGKLVYNAVYTSH